MQKIIEEVKVRKKISRRFWELLGVPLKWLGEEGFPQTPRFPERKYQNQGWDFAGKLREKVDQLKGPGAVRQREKGFEFAGTTKSRVFQFSFSCKFPGKTSHKRTTLMVIKVLIN